MRSIVIFIDYFGRWPGWFGLFLESCATNPTIDWIFHTDCDVPQAHSPNVKFIRTSLARYCEKVSDVLDVRFKPASAYNLCNIRPMLGVVHAELAQGYDFFGWGDIDVIYGDIRSIYDDRVLSRNVISSHGGICSGHLTLIRNEPWLATAFQNLAHWRRRLEDPGPFEWHESLDEAHLTGLFSPSAKTRRYFAERCAATWPEPSYFMNNYFKEQYSTPFTPNRWIGGRAEHPETWFWRDGVLTNASDRDRQFLYLHLMNFKAKRWVNEDLYADSPTWDALPSSMRFSIEDLQKRPRPDRNVRIDRAGLHLI